MTSERAQLTAMRNRDGGGLIDRTGRMLDERDGKRATAQDIRALGLGDLDRRNAQDAHRIEQHVVGKVRAQIVRRTA